MYIATIHAAKTNLSRLVERALAGEEVIIARGSTPVVRLVALNTPAPHRQRGVLKGKLVVTDAFFEPLPPEEVDAWNQ